MRREDRIEQIVEFLGRVGRSLRIWILCWRSPKMRKGYALVPRSTSWLSANRK